MGNGKKQSSDSKLKTGDSEPRKRSDVAPSAAEEAAENSGADTVEDDSDDEEKE